MTDQEPTHCNDIIGLLSDYVDGELREDLCREIEQHLAGCSNCRVVVDTLKKTVYLYHETAQVGEVPLEVRERLYKRLDLEEYFKKP